jgi:VWFA-related protein
LAAVALSPGQQQQPSFRATRDTVPVYATVFDRNGQLVTDLKQEDFEILDNDRKVELSFFSSETVPITAGLLVDVSTSMVGDFLLVRDAALKFIPTLKPEDRIRFGTFGGEVALSPHLTGDHATLDRVIHEELWPRTGPGTALWAGVRAGMRSLAAEEGRRVIVVLTDGVDACPASFYDRRAAVDMHPQGPKLTFVNSLQRQLCPTRAEIETEATREEFLIYGIGRQVSSFFTDVIRELGGGYVLVDRTTNLEAALDKVANELRHQYVLGFTPAAFDSKTHKLVVRTTRRELTARARRSYVADRR